MVFLVGCQSSRNPVHVDHTSAVKRRDHQKFVGGFALSYWRHYVYIRTHTVPCIELWLKQHFNILEDVIISKRPVWWRQRKGTHKLKIFKNLSFSFKKIIFFCLIHFRFNPLINSVIMDVHFWKDSAKMRPEYLF